MLEFLAVNFNLPTLIGAALIFGGTGWLLWRHHKSGGCCGGCDSCGGGCSCGGSCGGCGGCGGHGSSANTQ